jgi:hypothetical protein
MSDSDSVVGVDLCLIGDKGQQEDMQRKFTGRLSVDTEIVYGNWQDEEFLDGRQFDVILADYLIGAIDGFAPYYRKRF